ncbi:MAG TPA: hypothetical protein DD490_21385 [Acidobacteria bacterium]|nr:hypothetical protein [Acidobacteriota bacterium]
MENMTWVWVLIPIAAILGRTLRDFLRLQAQQRVLGTSNRELEKTVEELRQTNRQLSQRVENLETIVVSQTWNAVHASAVSDGERQQRVAAAVRQEMHAPPAEDLNRQRVEQLARRLGG